MKKYKNHILFSYIFVSLYSFCTLPMVDTDGQYTIIPSCFIVGFILLICFLLNLFPIIHLIKSINSASRMKLWSLVLPFISFGFWAFCILDDTNQLIHYLYYLPFFIVNVITIILLIYSYSQSQENN